MKVCREFDLAPEDEEMVCFLVAYHMDLSAAMRRDIFDPETIHGLARRVGSQERLKMLALITYADVGAVNPTSLSPWKAENLWRVYFLHRQLSESQCGRRTPSLGGRGRTGCPHSPAEARSSAAACGTSSKGCRSATSASTPPMRSFSTWRWLRSSAQYRADPAQAPARRFLPHRHHPGPSRPVRHPGRSAGRLGHEHPEGGRLFQ